MVVNRINDKLMEHLARYTHALSEVYVSEEIVLRFTMEDNSGDIIKISGSDIKYYVQNNTDEEVLSVHDLLYHDLGHIEELFDSKNQELKNLLVFLEDKEGMIKKQIMEAVMEHKKKSEDEEIEKYSYEEQMYELLFEDDNKDNDDLK